MLIDSFIFKQSVFVCKVREKNDVEDKSEPCYFSEAACATDNALSADCDCSVGFFSLFAFSVHLEKSTACIQIKVCRRSGTGIGF